MAEEKNYPGYTMDLGCEKTRRPRDKKEPLMMNQEELMDYLNVKSKQYESVCQ